MNAMPTLRIEMQGTKESVLHAFSQRFDEIKEYATKVIDASLNELQERGLQAAIVQTVNNVITKGLNEGIETAVGDAVYDYFSEGEGKTRLNELIREAVDNAIKPK